MKKEERLNMRAEQALIDWLNLMKDKNSLSSRSETARKILRDAKRDWEQKHLNQRGAGGNVQQAQGKKIVQKGRSSGSKRS